MEVVQPLIDKGEIKIVAKQNIENWKPDVAQSTMEQILTKVDNKVDAVLAMNDGTSGGVAAALASQGLLGIAALGPGRRRRGAEPHRQGGATVTVWKNARNSAKRPAPRRSSSLGGPLRRCRAQRPYKTPSGLDQAGDPAARPIAITRTTSTWWSTQAGSARTSSARA